MTPLKHISSTQNSLIKQVTSLKEKSRERKRLELFVLEGMIEFTLATKANYEIETLFYVEDLIAHEKVTSLFSKASKKPTFISVSKEVYKKLAYRGSTEGIIALVKSKSHFLSDLKFKSDSPLILVAEAPEKPGNIGALLRTADAANLDAVIITNPKSDLYNPNIIRSSVGGIFTTNIALASTSEALTFLQKKNIEIYCAALNASKAYTSVNFNLPSAIVMGTENSGLTEEWLQNSSQNIIIPMHGAIDSLNVSVSAAILIFEALRQRA